MMMNRNEACKHAAAEMTIEQTIFRFGKEENGSNYKLAYIVKRKIDTNTHPCRERESERE